jgi:hypothetical protein
VVCRAATVVHFIPSAGRRFPLSTAAFAAGGIGLMQLPGRVFYTPIRRRLSIFGSTATVLLVQAFALAWLPMVRGRTGLAVFVIAFGMGNGAATLVRATGIAELFEPVYGRTGDGALLPRSRASARSPPPSRTRSRRYAQSSGRWPLCWRSVLRPGGSRGAHDAGSTLNAAGTESSGSVASRPIRGIMGHMPTGIRAWPPHGDGPVCRSRRSDVPAPSPPPTSTDQPAPQASPPAISAPSPGAAPARWVPDDKRRTMRGYWANLRYNFIGVVTPGNHMPLLITAALTAPAFAWDAECEAYFAKHPHDQWGKTGANLGGGIAVAGLTLGFFSAGAIPIPTGSARRPTTSARPSSSIRLHPGREGRDPSRAAGWINHQSFFRPRVERAAATVVSLHYHAWPYPATRWRPSSPRRAWPPTNITSATWSRGRG